MGTKKTADVEVQTHIVPRLVVVNGQDVYYQNYKLVDGVEVAVLDNGKEVKTDNATVQEPTASDAAEPADTNSAE